MHSPNDADVMLLKNLYLECDSSAVAQQLPSNIELEFRGLDGKEGETLFTFINDRQDNRWKLADTIEIPADLEEVVVTPKLDNLQIRSVKLGFPEARDTELHIGKNSDCRQAMVVAGLALFWQQDTTKIQSLSLSTGLEETSKGHYTRFQKEEDIGALDDAITAMRAATEASPAGITQLPLRVTLLASFLECRFECMGSSSELNEAINAHHHALSLSSRRTIQTAHYISHTRSIADIEYAIQAQREGVLLARKGHPELPRYLTNLGLSLESRYLLTGEQSDIDEAVTAQREAVDMTPVNDESLAARLSSLGNSLLARFGHEGHIQDVDEAIELHRKAISATPPDYATIPAHFNNLGNTLSIRFERKGQLSDLTDAIARQQEAVSNTIGDDPDLPSRLSNLGSSLSVRYEHTGQISDLDDAIKVQREAASIESADLPAYLNNLGVSLRLRFECTGSDQDLDSSIEAHRKAVMLTPPPHSDRPAFLSNLGIGLRTRFERKGDLASIDEAKAVQIEAVSLTPAGHKSLPIRLSNLGNSLGIRFQRTGDLTDIDEAIKVQQDAAALLAGKGHTLLSRSLNNLGNSYRIRFKTTGNPCDIECAIKQQKEAILTIPREHADRAGYLNNLGISLKIHGDSSDNPEYVEKAIEAQREAVVLLPLDHPELPGYLTNLGNSLLHSFNYSKSLDDIDEAIGVHQRAVSLTVLGHAQLPPRLNNLSRSFIARHHQYGKKGDLLDAISNYRTSAKCHTGSPSVRLIAASEWASLSHSLDPAASNTLEGLEHTLERRHAQLLGISGLTLQAAGAACMAGSTGKALEWLAQGRCLVWSQLNHLRVPLDDLRVSRPDLAEKVSDVARALEEAGTRAPTVARSTLVESQLAEKASRANEAVTHTRLSQDWDQLLVEVRGLPGFENFLQPTPYVDLLKSLPEDGRVVITSPELEDELGEEQYRKARGVVKSRTKNATKDILAELWGRVPSSENLPRVWWCATGPLAFLPLHAAGIYGTSEKLTVSDYAISSYVPTVTALSDRVKRKHAATNKVSGVFLVCQSNAPGLSRIPGTTREARLIEDLATKNNIPASLLEKDEVTVAAALENMNRYTSIHLVCHAAQDADEPLRSGFFLHDGRLDLSTILKQNMAHADLAFLSACQTSTGEEKLSEEAVHLAAGMLAAGYRGVVATMWSIGDKNVPELAKSFYANLFSALNYGGGRGGFDGSRAAGALHDAVRKLRGRIGDSDKSLLSWVPYVHFGL
ncbi:hypothetical protein FA15DRAFT_708610 [Coprinopsis marcescibilis]|uniref:CHAT domain-containing protein n=1 Tax=Coprinopsis marcescibilis TaxID=230819 RepID=A0A5C3KI10_COPMA|nr:hypothetical protein FA15DRAFT_708610 [Coprinopsis marcescibilis]